MRNVPLCSPHGAKRNAGTAEPLIPDYGAARLHPGYGSEGRMFT